MAGGGLTPASHKMTMKKIFNILILGVMCLALSFPLAVLAIPPFPMNFTGSVTINGENAPIGSVIEVKGDIVGDATSADVVLADFTLTTAGTYGGARILAESAKLSVPEYTGDLTFRINSPQYDNNVQLADVSNTYTAGFSDFKDVDKTLTFTGATPNSAVVSIAVTPASASVVADSTQQFTATATYFETGAATADITSSCTWTSSSAGVATIGVNSGLATGVAAGSITITASYTDATYGALTDTASLTVTSAGGGGGGGGGGSAIQPPQISGIKVVKTTTTAIITWTTNKSATSKVNYGLTKSYGETVSSSDLVTSHSLLLTGLSISTTYNYQIKSKDSGGRTGTYSNRTFTTLSGIGEQEEEEEDMTIAQLKAAIADILVQIKLLQVELNKLLGVSVEGCTITSFDRSLKVGMTGDDVKCLQIILNSASDTRVAASGVGSVGNETNYFGSLTKAGVIKFQEKYASDILATWNLTAGTGYVGSTTLDKLNSLLK